jgi:uncharacterized protein YijF (DUF1287 family)
MRRLCIAAVLAVALLSALALPAHLQQRSAPQNSSSTFLEKLTAAAIDRAHLTVRYDPAYVRIAYPNGDVPANTGVCTDEVIRSYRAIGIDLQKEVHEDMLQNFSAYPNQHRWQLAHTDTNIDHRRVPNLQVFFARKGQSLPISARAEDYLPGELVTWNLGGGVPHIGIVVNRKSPDGKRFLIEHNIGVGPKLEDALFSWRITGHYRYLGPASQR